MTLTVKNEKIKSGRGRLPSKRTINLAAVADAKMDLKLAIPGVILILIAAVLIGKFAVADRLVAMSQATGETARLQSQLDQAYAQIASYRDMEEDYAHYTYAGMTPDELNLTSRADVIDMMERVIGQEIAENTWSISGNRLTVEVTRDTLQQINDLARQMETEPLVDFCTVTNAVMKETEVTVSGQQMGVIRDEITEDEPEPTPAVPVIQTVTANIIVYLRSPMEGDSQ